MSAETTARAEAELARAAEDAANPRRRDGLDDASAAIRADRDGLDDASAAIRADRDGLDDASAAAPAPAWSRFLRAHLISYPLVVMAALAVTPIVLRAVPSSDRGALGAELTFSNLLGRLLFPSLVVLVIANVVALPWVLGKDVARGRRIYTSLTVMLYAMSLFGAGAAWILLFYR